MVVPLHNVGFHNFDSITSSDFSLNINWAIQNELQLFNLPPLKLNYEGVYETNSSYEE